MRTGAAHGLVGHVHEAGFYCSDVEFLALIVPFVTGGIAAGEPVVIGYDDRKCNLLRSELARPDAVGFIADTRLYATPAGAIEAYRQQFERHLAAGAEQIRIAGDVPHEGNGGRFAGWDRYESAVNVVWQDYPVYSRCLYDATTVADPVRDVVERTHRRLLTADGGATASPRYQEVAEFERLPPSADPLEAAPPDLALVNASPRQTRDRVAEAARGRIDAAAFEELLFAVSEAVVNAHLYGWRPITVRVWTGIDRIVVRVHDNGPGPADPLTGLVHTPGGSAGGGLELWRIHQFTNIDVALLAADGFTVRLRGGRLPALAESAAAVIDNSRQYEAGRRHGEWLATTAIVTRQILAAVTDPPLSTIAEHAYRLADADLVAVLLPDDPTRQTLHIETAIGGPRTTTAAADLIGRRSDLGQSLCAHVFTTANPLQLADAHDHPGLPPAVLSEAIDVGPVLVVPLTGSDRTRGVLAVARLAGRQPFRAEDLQLASGFANQASLALELAEARLEREHTAAILDERDRIAADLHDHIIQRLYAAGLLLQGITAEAGNQPALAARLSAVIRDLDETIAQIRTTTQPPALSSMTDLRTRARAGWARLVRLLVDEAGPAGMAGSEIVAAPLREAVLHGLLQAVDHPYRDALDAPAPSFGPAALRRVVDAVEADPTRALTLTDMARIAAVSVRTLQELYRRHLDTTPTEHLRRARLARAHQQLQASDPTETTVSAVARRSGFVHLGRFAEAYRARYDEPPSATLRRTD